MANLSPQQWTDIERLAAESAAGSNAPIHPRVVRSDQGLVVSTLSPVAALAGIEALRQGGSAADAAITTALTQITTGLSIHVSFAGILEAVYHDATQNRTYTVDAGWNSWAAERDRRSIPLSPLTASRFPGTGAQPAGDSDPTGRRTLVPGFMAGIEALHGRFGRLALADLLAPAIFYAEQGVTVVSPVAIHWFGAASRYLADTAQGRRFLEQSGRDQPMLGDRFVQADLAATLRAVAEHGASAMYTGVWAHDFVASVAAAGGAAALADLASYKVRWGEALPGRLQGHEIRLSSSTVGGQAILEALALIEHTGLLTPRYVRDAAATLGLSRILTWALSAASSPPFLERFRLAGLDVSLAGRQTAAYARAIAPTLETLFRQTQGGPPPAVNPHSAAALAIDKQGNIAALVHTSNSLAWGSTGLVVGGVPIPDAAGLTSLCFPAVQPGDRLPHHMAPLIAFKEGRPLLALAAIGSSCLHESVQVILETLVNGRTLGETLAAPPLLLSGWEPLAAGGRTVLQLPQGSELAAQFSAQGIAVKERASSEIGMLRGFPAVACISGTTAESTEVPGMINFIMASDGSGASR